MKENITGTIQIHDFSVEVVRAAINFMYTGIMEFTEEVTADQGLKFGHRYQVQWLKEFCEKALIKVISEKTVVDLILFSYYYEARLLKEEVMKFFSTKSNKLHNDVLEGILSWFGKVRHHPMERCMNLAFSDDKQQ